MNNFDKVRKALNEGKAEPLADKVTIEKDSSTGEFRVPAVDGFEDGAYYTDDKEDAIGTAKKMYKNPNLITKFRSVPEFVGGKYEKMKGKSNGKK